MTYAVAFFVVAAYLGWLAATLGGWGWVLAWPAVSFAAVAGPTAAMRTPPISRMSSNALKK